LSENSAVTYYFYKRITINAILTRWCRDKIISRSRKTGVRLPHRVRPKLIYGEIVAVKFLKTGTFKWFKRYF